MKQQIYLISSSGRSGSRFLQQALSNSPINIPCFHEYDSDRLKRAIVLYLDNHLKKSELVIILTKSFETIHDPFIDCSYLYSYIPDVLNELKNNFEIRHFHIIRNGLNVVSSWYHKLGNEIYKEKYKVPNLELVKASASANKKDRSYFWPTLGKDLEFVDCHFGRVCHHYKMTNELIIKYNQTAKSKNLVPIIKFEDLINLRLRHPIFNGTLLELISKTKIDISRPININTKDQKDLNQKQIKIFNTICGEVMKEFNYKLGQPELVNY